MAEDEKKAAIKIQALHRGKKSRQDMDLNKKKMLDDAAEQRRMKEQEIAAKEAIQSAKEKEVEEQEEVKAATKIQASFRGTQARNELKTQDELVDRNERPVGKLLHPNACQEKLKARPGRVSARLTLGVHKKYH